MTITLRKSPGLGSKTNDYEGNFYRNFVFRMGVSWVGFVRPGFSNMGDVTWES